MGKEARWDSLDAMQLALPLETPSHVVPSQGKNGKVYTKSWVVELTLDLAGYVEDANLADCFAIEPAAGRGAFLVPMMRRLVASCKLHKRSFSELTSSLLAYELDAASATAARTTVVAALLESGMKLEEARRLGETWIRIGNYLLEAPHAPPADFVIGNPPYIRLEEINDPIAATYRTMYRTMQGRADLYIAFFEAALRELKSHGVCAFVCADRWMSNQYGAGLRELIARNFSVETVLTMHTADAFDQEVSAYPALTVIRRDKQGVTIRGNLESALPRERALAPALNALRTGTPIPSVFSNIQAVRVETWGTGENPWPYAVSERLALLRRLEEHFLPLESAETHTKVGIGVATGLDEVFITTDAHLVEISRLLPLAMAADTTNGSMHWSGHYLVNPWAPEGLVRLEHFPRLQAYLTTHAERLQKRHTARQHPGQWYRTIDRVNYPLLKTHKLYVPDIKNRLHPVLDQGQTYPHHNLYFIQSDQWDLEVLGGLLLSAIGQFFVECYGTRMRGGYLRFQAQYLRRIRVPRPQDISEIQAALLIRAFRQRDVALATHTALNIYQIQDLPEGSLFNEFH